MPGLPCAGAVLLALALSGCANGPSLNPVDWWHGLEGGTIAQQRPPPPNPNAPFPELGTVPAKPAAIDPATRARIAGGLVADRANAQYTNSLSPLPQPAPAQAPKPASPANTDPSAMSASLPAATAPAQAPPPPSGPPPPPKRAPVSAVTAAALSAPPPTPAPAAPVTLPTVPNAPPAPPDIAGVAQATAPNPAPPTPIPPVVVPTAPGVPLAVAFPAGSAVLPAADATRLTQLLTQRGTSEIALVGHGDADDSDPASQAAAMNLAWERAQALARALRAAGVPAAMLRTTAEATGHGGVVTILR